MSSTQGVYTIVIMNTNPSPSQPNPGSLPQPAVYAEADRRAEHGQQGQQDGFQSMPNQPTSPLQQVPPVNEQVQSNTMPSIAPQNVPQASSVLPSTPAQQVNALPQVEDTDDLSPQWLHTTEGLMRQHAQDPRVLAREFEKLKAHYIAGRYGKEVKQSSDEV